MKDYVHLFSSTNPVELDQIKFTLETNNISFRMKGENALGVGNVELTGIQGASIQVHENQLERAKSLLEEIGYGFSEKNEKDPIFNAIKYSMLVLAVAAVALLFYLFFS